jgi:hypothetical protein
MTLADKLLPDPLWQRIQPLLAFDVAGDRIKHIWAIRNPDKLRPWTTG